MSTTPATLLPPIEHPTALGWRIAFSLMRRKFGKVMTHASVWSVRMPPAVTTYYGKVGKLDKKLELDADTATLIREQVATVNGCRFCMDASRAAALKKSRENEAKFDAHRTQHRIRRPLRAARQGLTAAGHYVLRYYVARSRLAGMPIRTNDPPVLILTSLASGPKHGYALLQDIEAFAGVRLGPGTLYGAISRLEERGLIEAVGAAGRRRPYELTAAGAEALRTTLDGLRAIVDEGAARLARSPAPRVASIGALA